jgi:metal-responsive CopG/Arc/MetJ family transcriptional regulator
MMATKLKRTENKKKIGTVLDKEIVQKVKERSAKEGRSISDIIQDALIRYNEADPIKTEIRKAAVARFCSKPFNIKASELNELLNEDYYEQ